MILGGSGPRDVSQAPPSQSPAMPITERCERPHSNHVPHTYTRPGSSDDYFCPGGPLDPTLFDTNRAEAS